MMMVVTILHTELLFLWEDAIKEEGNVNEYIKKACLYKYVKYHEFVRFNRFCNIQR